MTKKIIEKIDGLFFPLESLLMIVFILALAIFGGDIISQNIGNWDNWYIIFFILTLFYLIAGLVWKVCKPILISIEKGGKMIKIRDEYLLILIFITLGIGYIKYESTFFGILWFVSFLLVLFDLDKSKEKKEVKNDKKRSKNKNNN